MDYFLVIYILLAIYNISAVEQGFKTKDCAS